MNLFVLPFPNIDPIALELGPIAIRWYGLAYMAGLLLGWYYVRKLVTDNTLWNGTPAFSANLVDDLVIWTTIGVIVGGRVGHILLYSPFYYLNNPSEILAVWHGGMSFHGGLLGTGLAFYLFAKKHKINVYSVMDVAAAAVPIGLFFGRIANFINAEIVGKTTNMPWAFVFPGAGEAPRHPVQLYEAILEGILLYFVLRFLIYAHKSLTRPGEVVGVFLIGYGVSRTFAEFFKDTNTDHILTIGFLKPGMVFSIPMVLLGLYFYRQAQRASVPTANASETSR